MSVAFRLLQNATEEQGQELDELGNSWQPIWVAVLLTLLQIIVWLTIFEWNRRSQKNGIVYDRRRQSHPLRTPPPLMRLRGPMNGWLAFEWWRMSFTDDYQRLAQQEYDERLEEEATNQAKEVKYDQFVIEAERQCRTEAIEAVPPDFNIKLFPEKHEEDAHMDENATLVPAIVERDQIDGPRDHGDNEGVVELPSDTRPMSKRHIKRSGSASVGSLEWDARLLSSFADFFNFRVLKNDDAADDTEDDEEHVRFYGPDGEKDEPSENRRSGGLHLGYVRKVNRRRLRRGQRELLRIVGLDSYMTLRFLEFGFDISFWPLLLGSCMLIPLYSTGGGDQGGFYSLTVLNLPENSGRLWALCFFLIIQYAYVLRRIWIEWEMFIPLRYEFLEHGDFEDEEYQEQYRNTCLVEYVPRSHKLDKDLYDFFDVLFPGQVRRAEVLINTEYLKTLVRERDGCIISYEDAYARKVHRRADYLRDVDSVNKHGASVKRCCRGQIADPRVPKEERRVVIHKVHTNRGNFDPRLDIVKDPRTYESLQFYIGRIEKLNALVDEEFLRLVQEQQKPKREKRNEFYIEKVLGVKYLTGSDTTRLHSSTAFVEFHSLTAKQQAIQCNITGTTKFMEVAKAPGLDEILWDNAHVSRALINTRRAWANVFFLGNLLLWSLAVAAIRSEGNLSRFVPGIDDNSSLNAILDAYIPVLVIEGLVRIAPFYIAFVCIWIRFKATSEIDSYVFQWYFGFRLVTFMFVIIGGSLVDSAEDIAGDPLDFLERASNNAAAESQFFTTYIIMASGFSIFFFMSQAHNVLKHWFELKVITEEAVSSRRLEDFRTYIKKFGSRELVPLFVFATMIGLLYGGLAPLTNLFVAMFFKLAYKVYRFMFVFVYGNYYEGGGVLFYTLNIILFVTLYIIILILVGYLTIHGTYAMAGVFLVMLVMTVIVHIGVWGTFVRPSKTLALTKARASDTVRENDACAREKSSKELKKVKKTMKHPDSGYRNDRNDIEEMSGLLNSPGAEMTSGRIEELDDETRRALALKRNKHRYNDDDGFFVYRQPSLNKATWEVSPRPYRFDLPGTNTLPEDKNQPPTVSQEDMLA